jgi:hypothetical protein
MAIAVRRTPLDKTLMYQEISSKLRSGALLHGIELHKEFTRLTFFAGK